MTAQEKRIFHYLADSHPRALELLQEARIWLLSFLPAHTENLRWKAVAFDKPGAKATVKDNICSLHPVKQKLKFSIPLGVFMKDPNLLLQGNLRYKRFLMVHDMNQLDKSAIEDIIMQSYHFDSSVILYKLLPQDEYSDLASRI